VQPVDLAAHRFEIAALHELIDTLAKSPAVLGVFGGEPVTAQKLRHLLQELLPEMGCIYALFHSGLAPAAWALRLVRRFESSASKADAVAGYCRSRS
jgi:hypothetical protein